MIESSAIALEPDTIAAISTPPGRGGIGIVRLSGPQALPIGASLVRTGLPLEHGQVRFAVVLDPSAPDFNQAAGQASDQTPNQTPGVDEALVTAFRAPRSYTGEDIVEIAAHGSPVILDALLRRALTQGARLARPGEFTERAFLSGRLDLTQAEAVHDMIAATTLDQARTAARQLGGALSRRIRPVKEKLLHLLALLEAGMDFASGELDDVETVPSQQIAAELRRIAEPLQSLAASFHSGHILRSGASLALIGLPNAGKSSLFNRLLDRNRSIVTPIAGTTRDTVEESLSIRGIPLRLVDTAGLRSPDEAVSESSAVEYLSEAERQGIARSREALADADLVLLVHDATQPFTTEEHTIAREIASRPHLLIANKNDLPAAVHTWKDAGLKPLTVSARTGAGIDLLREAIARALGVSEVVDEAGLNNVRQQEAVHQALLALEGAAAANQAHMPHEVLLIDLHAALSALDSLTGATTADDILARIFAAFCIGK